MLVFCPWSHDIGYKVICRLWLLVLGLEIPQRDQAVNEVQLLLVPGPGKLVSGMELDEARCCLFERI